MNFKTDSYLPKSSQSKAHLSPSDKALKVLVLILFVGCLFIPLYAVQTYNFRHFFSIVGVAFVVAFSALLSGGLLGFIFGIPRTLQQEGIHVIQQNGVQQPQETTYAVNTNLEQISDWLTKILVGVGLTQISSIPGALDKYADYVGISLGGYSNSGVFSIAILLFFLINGFLISYLWTRLQFVILLKQADSSSRLSLVETKLDSIDIDSKALSLVMRLLNPASGSTPPPQAEINAIIAQATKSMKAQIYWEAVRVRKENWQRLEDKPKMERTIPIFRALIASDTEGVYHANHGDLGYALANQRNPNWSEAMSELTEAIRLRGPWQTFEWRTNYELTRAICMINLDNSFKNGKPSDDKTKEAIISDLNAVFSQPELKEKADTNPDIKKWIELNKPLSFKK